MPQSAKKLRDARIKKDDEFYTSYTCAEYVISQVLKALPKDTLLMLAADKTESKFTQYCIKNDVDCIWDFDILKLKDQYANELIWNGGDYENYCVVTNPPFSKLSQIMPIILDLCKTHKNFYFCLIMPSYDVNTRYMNPFLKDVDLHVYRLPIKYQYFFQKSTGMYQKQGFNVLCTNIPNLCPLAMPLRKKYDLTKNELLESCYSLNFWEWFHLHGFKATEFRVDPLVKNQYVKVRWTKINN